MHSCTVEQPSILQLSNLKQRDTTQDIGCSTNTAVIAATLFTMNATIIVNTVTICVY